MPSTTGRRAKIWNIIYIHNSGSVSITSYVYKKVAEEKKQSILNALEEREVKGNLVYLREGDLIE